jgi:hypothetical protein
MSLLICSENSGICSCIKTLIFRNILEMLDQVGPCLKQNCIMGFFFFFARQNCSDLFK